MLSIQKKCAIIIPIIWMKVLRLREAELFSKATCL